LIEKQGALAQAESLNVIAEAEANEMKLTDEYLTLERIKAFSNNTRLYLGPSIPKYISEASHTP